MVPFRAAYKIHTLFQNIYSMPYAVDYSNFEVVHSKLYHKTIHKTIRAVVFLILYTFVIPTLIWRIIWMFFHWKSFTVNHIDQPIVYHLLYLTSTFIFLPCFFTQRKHKNEIVYVSNQLFKLVQMLPQKFPSSFIVDFVIKLPFRGKTMLVTELLDYLLSISLFTMVPGILFLSFAISYEPVQLVLGNNGLLTKTLSPVLYFLFVPYVAASILSLFLFIFVSCEVLLRYSSAIHFCKSSFDA